jgi:hypothetical protein
VFEAVQAQLGENRRRKRDGRRGPRWLLQGLTVCRRCGCAYYGKAAPRLKRDPSQGEYRHYRCIGTDGCRFGGSAVCDNPPVRGDRLEQAVWDRVRALLEKPERVAEEYRRRLDAARDAATEPEEVKELDRQIAALRRGIGRLIDSYAEGVLDRAEFEPRVAGLKGRIARLEERRRAATEAAEAERELTLVVGQLEDFAATVRHGLDDLDWNGRRGLIRTLVRRIEIDGNRVEVVFRIPPLSGSRDSGEPSSIDHPSPWQHCTSDHLPAPRLDHEAPPAEGADEFLDDAVAGEELVAALCGEAEVHPGEAQRGMGGEVRCQGGERVAVLHVGRHHLHPERIALCVDHQHPLPALDLLVGVVSPRPALWASPDALRVDDCRRRPPLAARSEAAAGDQDGQRPVQHRPQPPAQEPAPYALVRRQGGADRQPPPDAAVARQMPESPEHGQGRPVPRAPDLRRRINRIDCRRQADEHAPPQHLLDGRRVLAPVLGRPSHLSLPSSNRERSVRVPATASQNLC